MNTLRENMIRAWQLRGESAAEDLRIQQQAPRLVRIEYAAQRVADVERAMAEIRRWS